MKLKKFIFAVLLVLIIEIIPNNVLIVNAQKERIIPQNPTEPMTPNDAWNGDCVYFGTWEDKQLQEKKPIKWKVLNNDGENLLLMSDYALADLPYQDVNKYGSFDATWENCTLRKWLNEDFYNQAFNDEERGCLLVNKVENDLTQYAGFDSGPNTDDKVYILSYAEFKNTAYGFYSTGASSATRFFKMISWVGVGDVNSYAEKATSVYTRSVEEYNSLGGSYFSWWIDSNGAYKARGSFFTHPVTWSKGIMPVIKIPISCPYWTNEPEGKNSEQKNEIASKINIQVEGRFKDGQLKDNKGKKMVIKDTERYDDDYFMQGSDKIQGDLAKLSMLASASAYNKGYAEKLMENCKFQIHEYKKKKPTKKNNDTISYEIGIRKVDDYTIVAIWVKGTSTDYEWISNWNLGEKNRTHLGFSKAEKKMSKEIEAYLKKSEVSVTNDGKVKFWITGHSRGAAVANLYAKRMNDKIGKANVYAYTFATPRVSQDAKEDGYENIFNYLNPGDFVTEVAPEDWGYKRYGVDIELDKSKKSAMKKSFKKFSGWKYNGFGVEGKKSLVDAFIKYAGKNKKSYFKKYLGCSPEYFCKNGLGYVLAGDTAKGLKNCAKVCNRNNKAKVVFGKMVVDGKVNNKFGYAHTQSSYLCWLKEMYK